MSFDYEGRGDDDVEIDEDHLDSLVDRLPETAPDRVKRRKHWHLHGYKVDMDGSYEIDV